MYSVLKPLFTKKIKGREKESEREREWAGEKSVDEIMLADVEYSACRARIISGQILTLYLGHLERPIVPINFAMTAIATTIISFIIMLAALAQCRCYIRRVLSRADNRIRANNRDHRTIA